jgi:RNA polymerase sigma-70 factor (ECF subfamily)
VNSGQQETRAAIEQVARESYGKCIAVISSRTGDISFAEDCLAHAFEQALRRWPEAGIPDHPEAWLIKTAKNWNIDRARSAESRLTTHSIEELDSMIAQGDDSTKLPDQRLQLLFVCAHPAIDESIRTPLMLQTVLGIEARDIARIFVIPESTIAQRLVRAKRKIKVANIPFSLPEQSQMAERLDSVLEAVYGAYAIARAEESDDDLVHESLFLSSLLAELLPQESEVLNLHALLCFSIARLDASVVDGCYVPLEQQDRSRWDSSLLQRAKVFAARGRQTETVGRFQLEANIQWLHSASEEEMDNKWTMIAQLHDALNTIKPSLGAAVSRAAAIGRATNAGAGLAALAQLEPEAIDRFQPYWATKAYLLSRADPVDVAGAMQAYDRAIELSNSEVVRVWLADQRESLV